MKLKHILILGMMGFLSCITAVFSYWELQGVAFDKVFNVTQIEVTTTQQSYKAGDTVQGMVTLCKYSKTIPIIQWSIIDTYIRSYPPRAGKGTIQGCVENKIVDLEILSDSLPPDTYYFSGTATYQVNPLHTIIIPMKTNTFEIK